MLFLNSNYVALRHVIKPAKRYKDVNGAAKKDEGKYIQFENGKYETDDNEEIAIIQKYMKNHQGEISIVDKKALKKQELANAKKIIAEADAQNKMECDKYGNSKVESFDDGQPDESLQSPGDESISEHPNIFMNMSLKELQKKAKKMNLHLSKEQIKDVKQLKTIIIEAIRAEKIPDLNDESEE